MSDENSTLSLMKLWSDLGANLQVLGVAGLCGAFMKALFVPERSWKTRLVQVIAGLFSAVFLGGFFASVIEGMASEPAYAYLATGFVCGTAGELAISFAQRRILGASEKEKSVDNV